jgi:hypothetical protein
MNVVSGATGSMGSFSGPVFRPGDDGYDAERAGFNLTVDHHPELIVGAAGPEDVVAAVSYAVGGRDAAYIIFAAGVLEPEREDAMRRAHDELHEQMRPWATGGTIYNFSGVRDADPERVKLAFAPADYARLARAKAIYGPENMFRINFNIPPAR